MNDWNTEDWEVVWDKIKGEDPEVFRPRYNTQIAYAPDEMIYHVRNGGSITYRIPAENVISGHMHIDDDVDHGTWGWDDEVERIVSRLFGAYNFKDNDDKPLKPVDEGELMEVLNL